MTTSQSPAAAQPRTLPMSPQLRYILLQAKQLPPTEQLQLISYLVHHRLPISEQNQLVPTIAHPPVEPPPVIPDTVTLPDPQLLEFSAEILAYQQELSSVEFEP